MASEQEGQLGCGQARRHLSIMLSHYGAREAKCAGDRGELSREKRRHTPSDLQK